MFKQERKYYARAFLYALAMAGVLLLPFVIIDRGFFVYYGDYNAQQMPFYKTCIEAVQSGNFGLELENRPRSEFRRLLQLLHAGKPVLLVRGAVPGGDIAYLMAPLLALKIALSSLFAFVFIRRFVTKPQNALIGGLLYAFSGYSMYNIFFNHFHEAIVFFPLLLIGLEEAVVNKRRGAPGAGGGYKRVRELLLLHRGVYLPGAVFHRKTDRRQPLPLWREGFFLPGV